MFNTQWNLSLIIISTISLLMIYGIQSNYYNDYKKLYMIGFFIITMVVAAYDPKKDKELYINYLNRK